MGGTSKKAHSRNRAEIDRLPSWARQLSVKYCSTTANLYFVHGNIRDFLPHKDVDGKFVFAKIQDYISEFIFGNKDIIVYFDKSSDVSFCMSEMQEEYLNVMARRYPSVDDPATTRAAKAAYSRKLPTLWEIPNTAGALSGF